MLQKLILLLISVLVVRQTESFDLVLVSTTELPTKNKDQNDFQQFYSALKKIEMQNAQLQKQVENGITLNKDKLVQIENQLTNFIKKSSEDDIIVHQEIQELKHVISQYDDKSKKLNELDAKQQKPFLKNFKNRKEIQKSGKNVSGVYVIDLSFLRNFTVFCEMVTHGGGWTRVLARINGSQNFDMNWADYKNGFGNASGEFWIGLEPLYQLTNSEDYELLVEVVDLNNKIYHARYNKFKIGTEKEGYSLKVIEGYSGDAGDGLAPLIDMKFTTNDMDNDLVVNNNCAKLKGGWWYKDCYVHLKASKLTGIYSNSTSDTFQDYGIHWLPLQKGNLHEAKMMIRPLNN